MAIITLPTSPYISPDINSKLAHNHTGQCQQFFLGAHRVHMQAASGMILICFASHRIPASPRLAHILNFLDSLPITPLTRSSSKRPA